MIPKECKRLAEVDFPIAVVSKHSAGENTGRLGHPHTLHKWWARRPLAACRAMLLALLLPDPCDEHCPVDFKEKARQLLTKTEPSVGPTDKDLRKALLDFIGDFSNWDNSSNPKYLEVGRGLVKAAHPEETPLVVDPFAGGGSIPLEALRLGCDAFASDLNPVACLILKIMLEDIPRRGPELAEELRRVGAEIEEKAEGELAEFYPAARDGTQPIAYLWARTVRCEAPNCGMEIPLIRSFWLCKKAGRKQALRYRVIRSDPPHLELEVFEPRAATDVPAPLMKNGRAVCPACSSVVGGPRIQAQLTEQEGGTDAARLLAVVQSADARRGRDYRVANSADVTAAKRAKDALQRLIQQDQFTWELFEPLSPIRPSPNARGVSAPTRYGIVKFQSLFAPRQRIAMLTFAHAIKNTTCSDNVRHLLALALNKVAMQCSAHCRWKASGESLVDMFGRHALSMVWDFAESIPTGDSTGSWMRAVTSLAVTVEAISEWATEHGQMARADACHCGLPDESVDVWFTDPPYYDNIPYADLSDFFFVLMKRSLGADPVLGEQECAKLTPKEKEIVWNRAHSVDGKPKGPDFFEKGIGQASREGKRVLNEAGIGSVVFAHKTTEGWESLLSGITSAGWVITASWPIATELATRVSARDSASLATSIHLVCRPRSQSAPIGDWNEVLHGNQHKKLDGLANRVGDWMERLQEEGIRGADLVFACIGPALEIYSKYSKVEDAEGREIPLGGNSEAVEPYQRGFLSYVWETVGRIALEQVLGTAEAKARNGAAGAVEEDARLTALFLWTLQSTNGQNGSRAADNIEEDVDEPDESEEEATSQKKTKGFSLVYDVVRRFAQPLGIHLPDWEGWILETKKGVVRLLAVSERAKQLFGDAGASAIADRLEEEREASPQMMLFPETQEATAPKIKGRRKKVDASVSDEALQGHRGATTLDRIHAAMLLQASGRANALRALIKAEQQRGPDFLRLANALSALYPKGSEEKRLVDAMLLAVPR